MFIECCKHASAAFDGQPMEKLAANFYPAPMDTVFAFLVPAVLLAVLSALGAGLYALFRGGDFGRSYSNKLMRLRVVLQFLAILVLVAAFWWRTR